MISIQSFVAIAPPPDGVAGSNVYDPDTVTAVSLCPISDGGVVGVPVDVTFPTPAALCAAASATTDNVRPDPAVQPCTPCRNVGVNIRFCCTNRFAELIADTVTRYVNGTPNGASVSTNEMPPTVIGPTPPRSRNGDAPGASRCTTPCPFGVTPTRFITPVNADGVHVITGASAATPASPTNRCWPAPSGPRSR